MQTVTNRHREAASPEGAPCGFRRRDRVMMVAGDNKSQLGTVLWVHRRPSDGMMQYGVDWDSDSEYLVQDTHNEPSLRRASADDERRAAELAQQRERRLARQRARRKARRQEEEARANGEAPDGGRQAERRTRKRGVARHSGARGARRAAA